MSKKNKSKIDDGSKEFLFILGGYIKIYKGAMGILVRNGEAGFCMFHAAPEEIKTLGEFLIKVANDNLETDK